MGASNGASQTAAKHNICVLSAGNQVVVSCDRVVSGSFHRKAFYDLEEAEQYAWKLQREIGGTVVDRREKQR